MHVEKRVSGKMKQKALALCLLSLANCLAAAGDTGCMVFDESHTNGTEWTFHDVKFSSGSENNAYLYSAGGYIESPRFTHPVVRVSISFKGATAGTRRTLVVTPLDSSGSEIAGREKEFEPHEELCAAVAEWGAEEGVCQFRIGARTGSGNIHLRDCLVELADGVPLAFVPSGTESREVGGDSFVAAWNASEGADSYLVDLYRVDEIRSSWSGVLMQEDFGGAENSGGNPRHIADVQSLFPSLDGERIYVPVHTNGLVQIGTGEKEGWLVLRGCAAEAGEAVLFRAQRYLHKEEGREMPLYWTDGMQTNAFASVTLCDEMSDYEVPLDGVPDGASVALRSTKRGHGRVLLDSLAVVSGYSPASVATNAVVELARTANSRWRFSGLQRGATYLWRVRSVCGEAVSAPSQFASVVPEGGIRRSGMCMIFK